MKKFIFVILLLNYMPNLCLADMRQFLHESALPTGQTIQFTIIADSKDEAEINSSLEAAAQAASSTILTIKTEIETMDKDWRSISHPTYTFLKESINLAAYTKGWYDIASPSPKSWFIKKDYRRVELKDDPPMARYRSDNMSLDLNFMLPAFIIDMVSKRLIEKGYTNGWVAIGSVQRGWGKDIYTPWLIHVPTNKNERRLAYHAYNYGVHDIGWATITSADKLIDGRNKQIITPWYQNITVAAKTATIAVAYAVTVAAKGPKYGPRFLDEQEQAEGIVVLKTGRVFSSEAFKRAEKYDYASGGKGNEVKQKGTTED